MKTLLSIILLVSSLSGFAIDPERLIQKADRLAQRIDRRAYDLTHSQRQQVFDLLDNIGAILRNGGGNNGGNQAVFQDAYTWSYSSNGMNLSRTRAQQFATKISQMINPSSALMVYKDAYNFAYSSNGMNLSKTRSQAFGFEIIEHRDYGRNAVFICFRDAYNFAYSSDGMNLSRTRSRQHATNTCL